MLKINLLPPAPIAVVRWLTNAQQVDNRFDARHRVSQLRDALQALRKSETYVYQYSHGIQGEDLDGVFDFRAQELLDRLNNPDDSLDQYQDAVTDARQLFQDVLQSKKVSAWLARTSEGLRHLRRLNTRISDNPSVMPYRSGTVTHHALVKHQLQPLSLAKKAWLHKEDRSFYELVGAGTLFIASVCLPFITLYTIPIPIAVASYYLYKFTKLVRAAFSNDVKFLSIMAENDSLNAFNRLYELAEDGNPDAAEALGKLRISSLLMHDRSTSIRNEIDVCFHLTNKYGNWSALDMLAPWAILSPDGDVAQLLKRIPSDHEKLIRNIQSDEEAVVILRAHLRCPKIRSFLENAGINIKELTE